MDIMDIVDNLDFACVILGKPQIDSKYFRGDINLVDALDILNSEYGDVKLIDNEIFTNPEIYGTFNNSNDFDYSDDRHSASICLEVYGYREGLSNDILESFTRVMMDLLYNNLLEPVTYLTKQDMKIRDKSVEVLDALNNIEMEDGTKLTALLGFIIPSYKKVNELVKKSVLLSHVQLDNINKLEGNTFSEKIRYIIDDFFIRSMNKDSATKVHENKNSFEDNNEIFGLTSKIIHSKDIKSFKFDNNEYEVKDWNDMLTQLLSLIFSKEKSNFSKILSIKSEKTYFSKNKEDIENNPFLVPDSEIYVETKVKKDIIPNIVKILIKIFSYSDDILSYSVVDREIQSKPVNWDLI